MCFFVQNSSDWAQIKKPRTKCAQQTSLEQVIKVKKGETKKKKNRIIGYVLESLKFRHSRLSEAIY